MKPQSIDCIYANAVGSGNGIVIVVSLHAPPAPGRFRANDDVASNCKGKFGTVCILRCFEVQIQFPVKLCREF